jgi:hypothetical protein
MDEASFPKPELIQITAGEDGSEGSIFESDPPAKPTTIAPSSYATPLGVPPICSTDTGVDAD